MVGTIWGKGDIEIRALDPSKCEYLARYVTKKMTKENDPRLEGRFPEFSRQSRRPGIGYAAVDAMAEVISKYTNGLIDVPSTVRFGGRESPLGRYMRGKLRVALGLPEGCPHEVLRQAWVEQVLPVLEMAKADAETPSLREAFRKKNAPYEESLRMRSKVYEKGRL